MASEELIKALMKILEHSMDVLLEVLKIDSYERPSIQLHIDEKERCRCDGFYNHSSNTISLNATIVSEAFKEIANNLLECKNQGKKSDHTLLRSPKVIKLVSTLAHELKHREQHLNMDPLFKQELDSEQVLDLTKEEDLLKYEAMNIEFDARAFSRIGVGAVLQEWESFFDATYEIDYQDKRYACFLIRNMVKYQEEIPNEVIEQIIPPSSN